LIGLVTALQVVLPVALLLWLGLFALPGAFGIAVQAAGVGAFLLALALVAQWAVVPWWLPRVHGVLWVGIVFWHVLRGHMGEWAVLPSGAMQWTGLLAAVVLLASGAWYATAALRGRTLPPGAVVDIGNPFAKGAYLVGSGGSNALINAHVRTLDPTIARYEPWRGQSYAVDFFGLNTWGTRAEGLRPTAPEAYAIFGATLTAPCAGRIEATENAMPDFQVPEQDTVNRLGNHVLLRCGDALIVLAHMRQGSIEVTPGQKVAMGDPLGQVGNSGASTEPHLHVHAQRPAAEGAPPISGEPLAMRIEGRFLVRGDRLTGSEG